jgi:multidrug efflux pump subunit AcrA (membrane-fusion protein)
MGWVPKEEAARLLGVSVDTVERKLKRGEFNGKQDPRPRGWRWLVEVPQDVATAETSEAPASNPANAPADAHANEAEALRELIDTVKDEVAELRRQLQSQAESYQQQLEAKDQQLEAKDKQIEQLHILLQQAQAALPVPRDNRPWWRFWRR